MEHPEKQSDSSGILADLTPTDNTDDCFNTMTFSDSQQTGQAFSADRLYNRGLDNKWLESPVIYDQVGLKCYIFPAPTQSASLFRDFKIPKGTYIPYPFWHKFIIIPNIAFLARKEKGFAYLLSYKMLLKGAYSRKFSRVRKKRVRQRKVRIF